MNSSIKYLLSLLLILQFLNCKKDEDPTVVVNASVADSSMGSIDFKAGSYAVGAAVTFSATPQTGYTFVNWTDSSTNQTYSNNPLTINIDGNTTLIANFERNKYTLTVNIVGQGEVSQNLGSNKVNSKTVEYSQGDRVTLETVPSDGWTFSRWQGDASGYGDSVKILMDGSKTVTATFDYDVIDKVIGAWDINGESSSADKIFLKSQSGKNVVCGFYALIFNPDYSFTLYYSLGTISGEFFIQDPTSISLINYGSITNISFGANGVFFNLELNTGCSSNISGEKDDDYDADNPPKSFLEKLNGTYWKGTWEEFGTTYTDLISFKDNLPDDFLDLYWIDEVNDCMLGTWNSSHIAEVVENYNDQLIFKYTSGLNFKTIEGASSDPMDGTMSLRSDGTIQIAENFEDDSLDRIYILSEVSQESFNQIIALDNCSEEFTYIPDDNFEQALIDLGYDDVLDDYVLTENINQLIQLDLRNKNISNVTGIEGFISLTKLYLSNNSISSIDLLNNILLEELYISKNSISSIDLSNNLDLLTLDIYDNNLTQLDISKNNKLTYLGAGVNLLKEINLTNNPELKELRLGGDLAYGGNNDSNRNTIDQIDLSSQKELRYIDLKLIDLKSIDLSNQTKLIGLSIGSNPDLTSIDLSNNTSLKWLSSFNGRFTELDLSNQSNLGYLSLRGVQPLKTVDISNNSSLVSFDAVASSLECIQINQYQLDNQISNASIDGVSSGITVYFSETAGQVFNEINWEISSTATYSLDCSGTTTSTTGTTTPTGGGGNTGTTTSTGSGGNTGSTTSATGTTTSTTTTNTGTTSSTASGGGGSSGTTSSTVGVGNNSGTSSTTSLNFNCSDKAYIPDDNFESELISLGLDDVMDNYVCKNNINTITSLDLRAKSISNLTGVNSFTAIENLDISHNNLGNSVLISNLGQLQILKARSSGITSIDLSNNPNLSTLDIDYNPITTLDVSSLNNLIKLWCGNTKLTNLNISNNIELTELRCQNNSNTGKFLTDLDLSNNSKITWLQLSYQKISFLDITSLPDTIETLLLNYNSELECVKATSIQINNRRDCLGGPQGWCIPDGVELSPNCNSGTTSNTSVTNDSTSTNNNCTISSSITSAQGSDNQTVVQGNQLQTITYSISSDCDQLNDTNIYGQQLVSGLPPGVTALLSGNTVTISGTPTTQASGTYNYIITIDDSVKPTNTVAYAPPTVSTTISGIINVEAPASLVLSSNQNTLNQYVCNYTAIDPVVFQLGGNATLANVTGLPSGITSTLDASLNTITLRGSPSVSVATSTTYIYNISNADGSPTRTVTGSITVNLPSQITRTSGDANIVVNSNMDGGLENQLTNTSFSLSFQIGNAAGYNLTWDDNAIFNPSSDHNTPDANFDPNTGILTISGDPGATETTAHPPFKTYNYTITTTGNNNGCSEASISGSIELVDGYVPPETYTINVTASNASDYTLSGSDRNGDVTGNDPSVTLNVGDTIDFVVDASGHPFYLKTVQGTGTSDLISGVTNNGATNGTVSWTPSATGTYYYQCSLHNGMYGTITVN